MKAPFGSRALIGGYVPSRQPRPRRTQLRLPELVLALVEQQAGWFTVPDLADAADKATVTLDAEHYRDRHAQCRVVSGQLQRLARAGRLERRAVGRAVQYRVRGRCGACAGCLGEPCASCAAWAM